AVGQVKPTSRTAVRNSLPLLAGVGAFSNLATSTFPGSPGGATMWMPGALIGGLLAYQVYSDAWALGALIGALAGLVAGRMVAKPSGERRLVEVEGRPAELRGRLEWLE